MVIDTFMVNLVGRNCSSQRKGDETMNVKVWMTVGRGGKGFHSEQGKSKCEVRSDKCGGEQRMRMNTIVSFRWRLNSFGRPIGVF